jgi:guanine deaminase
MYILITFYIRYGLPAQSHLSEDSNEIAFVKELHDDIENYASVYEKFGLLHSGVMMAHCIHCTDEELETMKRVDAAAIHCPSSNFLLGSGIMDARMMLNRGIRVGLGTDVAGGASPSMLDCVRNVVTASRCMKFFLRGSLEYDHHHHQKSKSEIEYKWLNTKEVFHLATQGGAEAVGMGNVIGNFLPGKKLDCLIVDTNNAEGPIDELIEHSLYDRFEKFLYVGDDRNIQAIIVDGKLVLGKF